MSGWIDEEHRGVRYGLIEIQADKYCTRFLRGCWRPRRSAIRMDWMEEADETWTKEARRAGASWAHPADKK